MKTKLDPGYTTQKSFSQFTPGQGLKGSRGQKVPRGSQGVIRDVLACKGGVKGVPEGEGGHLEGPGARGLSGCLWGPKGPRPGDIQWVPGGQRGCLRGQGVGDRCHKSEEELLKGFPCMVTTKRSTDQPTDPSERVI